MDIAAAKSVQTATAWSVAAKSWPVARPRVPAGKRYLAQDDSTERCAGHGHSVSGGFAPRRDQRSRREGPTARGIAALVVEAKLYA